MIYFDQAASSFPKPPEVTERMIEAITEIGANPGRGGHSLASRAAKLIIETREKAATIFGCSNPKKCLFYSNATIALNQAIKGFPLNEGDHVITTSFEHNSVRRPLEYVKSKKNIEISYIEWQDDQNAFIQSLKDAIKETTKLIVMTHASNITGAILPLDKVLHVAKLANITILVDASQTAGHIEINMKKQGIDMLVFPGHKGLLGPQGTGMLLVEGEIDLMPIHHGGTGESSEDVEQPSEWPGRMESGTLNTPGIAGLLGAFSSYEQRLNQIVPRETILIKQLYSGLVNKPDIVVYGPDQKQERMPLISFNIKGIDSQEIAMILDTHYGIAVRAGIHCSPLTHQTLGTTGQGAVRVSVGIYNTEEEVDLFLNAISEIVESYKLL